MYFNFREKTSQCCNDVEIGELHMRSTGVYDWVVDGKTGKFN